MDTVYIVTHMAMATCIITILYVSLTSPKTISDQNNNSSNAPLSIMGVKLIVRTLKTLYRIAMSILITHLK
ncbi:hypothetical protein [Mucilaginibacter sp.]|uniref:hypothetical protein n=1 Tax=Mucilaginibacter sp. TaxID=1882438 RepID=UPI003565BB25